MCFRYGNFSSQKDDSFFIYLQKIYEFFIVVAKASSKRSAERSWELKKCGLGVRVWIW